MDGDNLVTHHGSANKLRDAARPSRRQCRSGCFPPPPVLVDGVGVHPFTVAALHAYMECVIESRERARIYNVNVHALNIARADSHYRRLLEEAEAVFCDGDGVRLAARLLGRHIPERITYADWVWQLAAWAAAKGYSIFLLGAEPGVAERARDRLTAAVPGLRVAGVHHGFLDWNGGLHRKVVEAVNSSGAQILIVGMGMPAQEYWLDRWWSDLTVPIGLAGGACFDFVTGDTPRAPRWMRRCVLEWLHRLAREPRRLFRRYVVGNPSFAFRILREMLTRK